MRFRARRGPPRSPVLVLVLWMVIPGGTILARAATGPRPTDIELSAAGCGSLAELNDQITRRSDRIRLTTSSGAKRGLKAEIRSSAAGRREVVLTVVQSSGQPFSRHVEAQTCDEAMEALALLIVLALDPDAVTRPEAPREPAAGSHASSPGVAASSAPRRSAAPASTPRPADVTAPKPDAPPHVVTIAPPPPAQSSLEPRRGLLVAGASGLVVAGPTPRILLGSSLHAVWGWDRGSPFSPAVAIGVGHSERSGMVVAGGTASFALTAAQLEACPVWIGMHRRFGARACALAVVGALTAEGTQTVAPEVHRKAFALFGGTATFSYEPGWRVVLTASGELGIPLQRYAFQFDPSVFYRAAPVCVTASIGVGIRFY